MPRIVPDQIIAAVAAELRVPPDTVARSSFIDLGGDSLQAMRVSARVKLDHGVHLAPGDLLLNLPWTEIDLYDARPPAGYDCGTLDRLQAVPATPQQSIVLLDYQLHPESTAYLFHAVIEFPVAPEDATLQVLLDQIVAKNPLLLATFDSQRGRWMMTVGGSTRPRVVYTSTTEPVGSAAIATATLAGRPFRLGEEALIRWTLATRGDGSAALIHTEHHLVHDGTSFNLLLEAFAGKPARPAPSYEIYARQSAESAALASRVSKARSMADNLPSNLVALDSVYSEPHEVSAGHLRLPLPAAVSDAIIRSSAAHAVTTFVTMLGGFADAVRSVCRPSGPFVIGVAVANREPEFADSLGMFVSTVPIVFPADPSGTRYEAEAGGVARAIQQSDFEFDEYIRCARQRGFDTRAFAPAVAFSKYRLRSRTAQMGAHEGSLTVGVWNGSSKFDLSVVVVEDEESETYELVIEYRRSFIDDDNIWTLWTRFVSGLSSTTLAVELAPVPPIHPSSDTVRGVAVMDQQDRFTYEELDALSAGLANVLNAEGAEFVGILGPSGARSVAAQYVVHRAGHTFVPLSPLSQPGHIAEMVRLAGCRYVLLTGPSVRSAELPQGIRILDWDQIPVQGDSTSLPHHAPEHAYALFTSGTTGAPKGVLVRSMSLLRLSEWGAAVQGMQPGMIVSQVADLGFDASIWEIWPAIRAGATLRVVRDEVRRDPVRLLQTLVEEEVEVAFAPTPVAELLMAAEWPPCRLRILGAGGDRLHAFSRPQTFVAMNLYGPTEATSVSTFAVVDSQAVSEPTIGRSVPYGYVRIVDEHGRAAGIDEEGELWVGGDGVAAGYLGLQQDQDARFVPDPFSLEGRVAYRTGDFARWRPDGEIDFLGRRDRQVKVSGVRLELGSVEATVLGLAPVRSIAVDVIGPADARRLVIYVAAVKGSQAVASAIIDALPSYLRGSKIVVLDSLPLNRNGKVDLAQLREHTEVPKADADNDSTSPRQRARRRLSDFLSTVDGGKSWFGAGGTSLGAAQFVAWAADELGIKYTLSELLETSNLLQYLELDTKSQPFEARKNDPEGATLITGTLSDLEKLELATRLLNEVRGNLAR